MRILDSESVHDHLEWPNGHKGEYFVIEGSPFVIVIVERNGQIAVVEQYRYTVDEVTTELPKGGIEPGEFPEDAARRELCEEVGCSVERLDLLASMHCSIGNSRKRCYVFLAHGAEPLPLPPERDATEDDMHCMWMPIDEFRAKVRSGEIEQDSLAAWGIYREQ